MDSYTDWFWILGGALATVVLLLALACWSTAESRARRGPASVPEDKPEPPESG